VPPRDLRQTDLKAVLQSVMSNWLPLSKAVLGKFIFGIMLTLRLSAAVNIFIRILLNVIIYYCWGHFAEMVCSQLPSPLELPEAKIERLMKTQTRNFSALPGKTQELKSSFLQCSGTNDAPTIIFVSKMFATETSSLPEKRPKPLTADEIASRREQAKQRILDRQNRAEVDTLEPDLATGVTNIESSSNEQHKVEDSRRNDEADLSFIAFARVYSGTVRKGQHLYVLGPKYDPSIGLEQVRNLLAVKSFIDIIV